MSATRKRPQRQCSICGAELPNLSMANDYPGLVCWECDDRAVNEAGSRPEYKSHLDDGENPVFISGVKCWRRYRFGGFVTMRDQYDCQSLEGFYARTFSTPEDGDD